MFSQKFIISFQLVKLVLFVTACATAPATQPVSTAAQASNPLIAQLPTIALTPIPATATPTPTDAGSQPSAPTSPAIVAASPTPTDISSYATRVGRIISSSPTTVKLQGLNVGTNALWYWSRDGWLARADPASGREVAAFHFDDVQMTRYGNPHDMAVDGKTVWVTDAGQHAVARIDPNTNQIVERISLEKIAGVPNAVSPMALALDGNTIWVSDFDQNLVLRVDTGSKQVLAIIDHVKDPAGIAISPDGVWVVQHRSNSIVRIDPTTNKIVATVELPGPKGGICGMCLGFLATSQDAIWVPLYDGKGVARVDPKTNQVVAIIPLEMVIANVAIGDGAIWAVGNLLAGPNCFLEIAGVLARIDPVTNTVVGTLTIPCAHSVAVVNGEVWVGTWGNFKTGTLYRIKPDP